MGLDMYAYTIDKRLVDDDQITDVQVHKIARRAAGFITLRDEEVMKMTEDQRKAYWDKEREALRRAKEEGWVDTDFAYWRKFNALHGWMEDLYREKGGTSESFNCNTLRLSEADIDRLEAEIDDLKPRSGFFWGSDEIYPEDLEDLKTFIAKARAALAEGKAVFYDSWW